MPDDANPTPGQSIPPDAGHIPMTEEMDSAKWTLPPIMTVVGVAVALALVIAVVIFFTHNQSAVAIAITKVATMDMQDSTLVAIQVKIDNQIEQPIWIKNIEAEMEAADGKKYPDHAASANEAARYLQAFSALAEAKAEHFGKT